MAEFKYKVKTIESTNDMTQGGNTVLDTADIATSTSLGTSNTVVPSQGAVKTYVDNAVAGKDHASEIAVTTTGFGGGIFQNTASYDTVQECLDILDDHNHDSRYFTESEVTSALALKSDTTHNHTGVYAPNSHTHDDRYFTESEVTSALALKSDTTHNHTGVYAPNSHSHGDLYYTESEITSFLATKSDTTHNHTGVYAPNSHSHGDLYYTESETLALTWDASDIVSGTIDNARLSSLVKEKNICMVPFESDANVAVGDGKVAFSVPLTLNNLKLTAAIATVHTKGVTGTTNVQIRRRRPSGGADINMLSTAITIGDEYYCSDGVVDTSSGKDTLNTGDQIYIDVDAIHTQAPTGLSVTLTFA